MSEVIPVYQMSNGVYLPAFGLGCYRLRDEVNSGGKVEKAIKCAVQNGYWALDTAERYGNEHLIGRAWQETGAPTSFSSDRIDLSGLSERLKCVSIDEWARNLREPHGDARASEIRAFVTTKVFPTSFEPQKFWRHVFTHLEQFGRSCGDLLLLHWPGMPRSLWLEQDVEPEINCDEVRFQTWRLMEEAYHQQKFRAIGLSNYSEHHLRPLLTDIARRKEAGDPKATFPMCNQSEFSPLLKWSDDLVELMKMHEIVGVGYSVMCQYRSELVEHPLMQTLASKHKRSPGQIALRFALQCGVAVIPKSASSENQKHNIETLCFHLSATDMEQLHDLQRVSRLRVIPASPYDVS